MTKVTYTPPTDEPGHPASVTWNGVTFMANVPIDLDDDKHAYLVPIPEKYYHQETDTWRTKTVEKRVAMAEMARTNRFFTVDGTPAKRAAGRPRKPRTAAEYHAHAINWITTAEDSGELAERWEAEEDLRGECEVGEEELASKLRPLFDAKFHELKKAEE
jgi:hypothetical protein